MIRVGSVNNKETEVFVGNLTGDEYVGLDNPRDWIEEKRGDNIVLRNTVTEETIDVTYDEVRVC